MEAGYQPSCYWSYFQRYSDFRVKRINTIPPLTCTALMKMLIVNVDFYSMRLSPLWLDKSAIHIGYAFNISVYIARFGWSKIYRCRGNLWFSKATTASILFPVLIMIYTIEYHYLNLCINSMCLTKIWHTLLISSSLQVMAQCLCSVKALLESMLTIFLIGHTKFDDIKT